MEVMLLDNVEKLGKVGDIVSVARGYARNYLVPRNLAVVANDSKVRAHKHQVEAARAKFEQHLAEITALADKVKDQEFSITKKATDDGKLFGSVVEKDVKKLLDGSGIDLEHAQIDLSKVEKKTGAYPVKVSLFGEVEIGITLNVEEKK